VILELKFGTRFPDWMRELVRRFHLMQFSASKYSEGILLMGEHHFHDGDCSFDWEGWTPRLRERRGDTAHRALISAQLPESSVPL
jgi:thioesterase domain-containing protein